METLKQDIISAYEMSTPDVLEKIKARCLEENHTNEIAAFNKRNTRVFSSIITIAATLILVCASLFTSIKVGINRNQNEYEIGNKVVVEEKNIYTLDDVLVNENSILADYADEISGKPDEAIILPVATTIYIDVNPSIEVTVDENKKVINIIAKNEDAKKILSDLKLEGTEINTALKLIIGRLYVNGYLAGDTAAILISVDTKQEEIFTEVDKEIKKLFVEDKKDCEVIIQTVDTKKYEKEATANNISVGKMEFIDTIVEKSLDYTVNDVETLSKLTIYYLNEILKELDDNSVASEDKTQSNTTGNSTDTNKGHENTPTNPITETFETTTDVISDSLEFTGEVVDDALDFSADVVQDSLDFTTDVVEDSLEFTADVVSEATDFTQDVIEEVTETVENILKGIFK